MKYRSLGATGIEVSEIGLGMWPAGGSIVLAGSPTGYGVVPETEAVRAIQRAIDLGANFFDTSDSYGVGRAERILGNAIASRRGQVVVATKGGWVPDGSERWMKDLSADHLRASARRSLRRMRIDVIDLYQIHAVPDSEDEMNEALDALEELKTLGMIRAAGASVGGDLAAGTRFVESGRIDVVQVHYNLLQQNAAFEFFDLCRKKKMGVIASVPLAYGFLGGRYTRSTIFPNDDWRSRLTREEVTGRVNRVEEMRFLSGGGTRSLLHAALQFVIAHPAVSTTIPGFRNAEQVEGVLDALDGEPLSDIEIARAKELARIWSAPPSKV